MSRGKRTNPLSSPAHRQAKLLPSSFSPLKLLYYQMSECDFSPAQRQVRDIVEEKLKPEADKLDKAFDLWLDFRGEAGDFVKLHRSAAAKLQTGMPFACQDLLTALKSPKQSYFGTEMGAGSPWLVPGREDIWYHLLFQCLIHGPSGEKIAAEKLYPAILKYQDLKAKHNPREQNVMENITKITDYLARLHNSGRVDSADLIALRKYFHHRHYNVHGARWDWPTDVQACWDSAASEVVDLTSTTQRGVVTAEFRLKLLLAFNQLVGAPFDNEVAIKLLDPELT